MKINENEIDTSITTFHNVSDLSLQIIEHELSNHSVTKKMIALYRRMVYTRNQ